MLRFTNKETGEVTKLYNAPNNYNPTRLIHPGNQQLNLLVEIADKLDKIIELLERIEANNGDHCTCHRDLNCTCGKRYKQMGF